MISVTPAALVAAAATVLSVLAPVPSAGAQPTAEVSTMDVLARERVGGYDVVATPAGDVVAVWERASDRRNRVVAAVRPAGGDWLGPSVLDSWRSGDVDDSRGDPQLVAGPDGTVVAVWVDPRHRLVRATWAAPDGWTGARRVSAKGEVARGPRAASNPLGRIVVTWQRRVAGRMLVRAAVRRDSGWFVSTTGRQGPRGLGARPPQVDIDDAGNVSVAWYRLRPKPPHSGDGLEHAQNRSLVSRLAADATTWETPHAFGDWEPYFHFDQSPLVVEAGGTAWLADWAGEWNAPQPGPVWTRTGGGEWVADDRAPYPMAFVSSDDELVSWSDSAETVNTRQPDGEWTTADLRATTVVLSDAGHAAAISVRQDTLLAWIRDATGAWGPEQVIARNAIRQNDRGDESVASATIAPDGTVTVLWGTYANEFPGEHPERGPDLRAVQFSAVVPTLDR